MAPLARARAHTHWKHGGFALIVSSVSWKMTLAHPIFFFILCNQLIKSFVWEKTDVISIAENWINERNSGHTVFFSILQFGNHVKKYGLNFQSTIGLSVWIKLKLFICVQHNVLAVV